MPRFLARWVGGLLLLAVLGAATRGEGKPDPEYDGKRLSGWLKQLESKDPKERWRAREALASLVKQGRAAVPPLVRALLRPPTDARTARARVDLLAGLGPAAVPGLTAGLWDEDPVSRMLALLALRRLGSAARPAVPSLLQRLKDGEDVPRRLAAECLGGARDRSAIPALTEVLEDKVPEVRVVALAALLELGADSKPLVPVLRRRLGAKEAAERRVAAHALAALGPEAREAVPALVKAVEDEEAVRGEAVAALGRVGRGAEAAAPALRAVLKDPARAGDHLAAAEALWRVARHPDALAWLKGRVKGKASAEQIEAARLLWCCARSPEAVLALAGLVRKGTGPALRGALPVLGQIGPGAKEALPAVLPALKHKDAEVRHLAVTFVGRLGGEGRPAAAALRGLLADPDGLVRLSAAWALWQVEGDRRGLAVLKEALGGEDRVLRPAAAVLLGRIGPPARSAAPALREALRDGDARLRLESASALWQVARHPDALPALVALLRDGDHFVRREAALWLGGLYGAEGKPAVPAPVRALWDEESEVRTSAAEALGRLGPAAGPAVPALIALLGSGGEAGEHSAAAEALGLIGPGARPAAAALRKGLEHPDPYVRVHAALALWRVAGKRAGRAAVTAGLRDRSARVRITAAEALWHLKRDRGAITFLVDALREAGLAGPGAANERYMAARALGRIGPPARSAASALRDLLGDEDEAVRATAAAALKSVTGERPAKEKGASSGRRPDAGGPGPGHP